MRSEIKRWDKNRINYIHFGYGDFYDFDSFVVKLLEVLKIKVQYSLLLKVNFNKDRYAMIGSQIGFNYEDDEDIEKWNYFLIQIIKIIMMLKVFFSETILFFYM